MATIQQYFPVFDKLRKEFFVGELIWNFADFMTIQSKYCIVSSVNNKCFIALSDNNSVSGLLFRGVQKVG